MALYLVVLVLQLNPQVPVVSMTAWRWFIALITFYGPYAASVIYFLILIREALASRPLSPAWLSVRLMVWLGAAIATAAAIVTWANLRAFRAVLSEAAAERMQEGATATTVFAGVLFSVALMRYSFGRRGSRAAAVLLAASILLLRRGATVAPRSRRATGSERPASPDGTARRRASSARASAARRRRVNRLHPSASRGRAAAEFRPAARFAARPSISPPSSRPTPDPSGPPRRPGNTLRSPVSARTLSTKSSRTMPTRSICSRTTALRAHWSRWAS